MVWSVRRADDRQLRKARTTARRNRASRPPCPTTLGRLRPCLDPCAADRCERRHYVKTVSGQCRYCSNNSALALRWNGTTWQDESPANQDVVLQDVAASGPGNVWSDGVYYHS